MDTADQKNLVETLHSDTAKEIINLEDSDNGEEIEIEDEIEAKEEAVRDVGTKKGTGVRAGKKGSGLKIAPLTVASHKKSSLKRNIQEVLESEHDLPGVQIQVQGSTPQPLPLPLPALSVSATAPLLSVKRSSSRFSNATIEKPTVQIARTDIDTRIDLPFKDASSGEKKTNRSDRSVAVAVAVVPSGRPARSAALYAAAAMVASKGDW